ncbi:MAG: STAS domain-containing protein [Prevotellaceae bacterium]|nr:STAS domain-containing protein [Prevotellaceae bacterium]
MAKIVRNGNNVVIESDVRLDTVNAGDFECQIEPFLKEAGVDVVFDCHQLDYISSTGLRVLLKAQKNIMANKGNMKLTAVKPQIKKVFDMTGFSRFLKIEE